MASKRSYFPKVFEIMTKKQDDAVRAVLDSNKSILYISNVCIQAYFTASGQICFDGGLHIGAHSL